MKGKKSTRSAFLTSLMSLVLCFAMLLGTTFAWFTDTASTAVNKIQAGNLQIELQDETGASLENKTLKWVKAAGHENDSVLWEPGCTYDLQSFKIVNTGNLNLKYKVMINGIAGDAKLNEAITWTYAVTDANGATTTYDPTIEHVLNQGQNSGLITITGKMKTDAGNEYQGLSIDGIGITVMAAQMTGEFDSFNNTYDTNATYMNYDAQGNFLIGSADELMFFAKAVNSNMDVVTAPAASGVSLMSEEAASEEEVNAVALSEGTSSAPSGKYATQKFKLTADIDLAGRTWTPVGSVESYPSITFAGTFDGDGHTISNLTASDKTTNYATAGLFGSITGVVRNVTLTNVNITSTHYAGGIVGFSSANVGMKIENCHVDGGTITSTPELMANGAYDNGDKVGGIIGYCVSGDVVTDCSVKNVTITGYRDLGGIVGCAAGTVTNNTVGENVKIIVDNSHNYKGYTALSQHNAKDIVGREEAGLSASGNSGAASVTSLLTVSTADQLSAALNKTYNSDTIIKLANDINLSGVNWPACVLSANNGSTVTLDGNNKTISGLNATNAHVYGYDAYGLIASVFGNVEIKNLTVTGATVTVPAGNNSLDCGGVVVGYYYPLSNSGNGSKLTFTNCKVVNSTVNSNMFAAGLVGYVSGDTPHGISSVVVNNCEVSSCTFNGGDATGALIAANYHVTTITGATVTDNTVNGGNGYSAGALVGTDFYKVTATGVTVSGNTFSGGQKDGLSADKDQLGWIAMLGSSYSVNGTELKVA